MGSDEKLGILVGFAIALAVAGFGGCSSNACFRNSDCASGESCSAGSCVIDTPAPASDAASEAAEAGTDAGSDAADANEDANAADAAADGDAQGDGDAGDATIDGEAGDANDLDAGADADAGD